MQPKLYKKIRILSLILSLSVLTLLFYSIINYSILENQINEALNQDIGKYSYFAIFILSFLLEISPQPFASAIVPFINGLVIGLNYNLLLIITLLGVVSSSFTAYILGLYYGRKITIKIIEEDNYQKYLELFKKYGKFAMTIAAVTPFPYFPILAGIFKMGFKEFIVYAAIPRILYFLVLTYILSVFV